MCDYVVLPLLNSSFEPGRAREVVEGFVDVDLRNIARAELFYFTGQAEECCEITKGYLSSRVIELKLSACILYGYSNLSLGNVAAAKRGMEGIQSCVKIAMKKKVPKDVYASCLLAGYVGAVLLHLPTDGMPAFGEYSRMLPEGLRLFATYVMAHHTYLNGEIWSAYGMGKAALFMADRSYPISMTYIHCMMAVCAINRKHKQEAQEEMLRSWELAKMDGFLEPFIEHHGLLRGLIEAWIRNRDPEAYQRITEGVISFSRGWMALHNPENRRKVTGYLSSRVIELKLSACILYGYSNLSLGNVAAAKRGMEGIQSCVKIAMKKKVPKDVYASCLLAGYVGAVLLHLPTDGMPAFGEYSRMLPEGLRLFATYVMAHHTYLNGEIWSAYGMGKAALFMADRSYPISMTYIHCMMAVCAINRKHKQEAQEEMLRSWELAKMDGFLEPFIEHHGLLRGLIEAWIRNRDPEAYQRITEGVISFSRGWMALHNPENRRKVTGELSTMEFSIAMLASGGWTNKEIGEHLGISINTVKHYLTDIFCKLNVKKRDELKKFMLK